MVGSGADLRAKSAPAGSLTSKYYRLPVARPLILAWVVCALAVPLLMGAIGYVLSDGAADGTESATVTTTTSTSRSGGSGISLAPLSIFRSEKNITLSGDLPADDAKAALINGIKESLGQDMSITDQIHIDPNVHALEFAKAGPFFTASAPIPDFSIVVDGDTITLSGSPPSADVRNAVDQAAATLWPNLNVNDKMEVKESSTTPQSPATTSPAEPTPGAPALTSGAPIPTSGAVTPGAPATTSGAPAQTSGAPVAAPPAAPPVDPCVNLQATINQMTGGAIVFDNDGVSLPAGVQQDLNQVAGRLKVCPNARVTVNGYTDNSGGEAINIPLSEQRASTVVDYLVNQGVGRDRLSAKGLGSLNPIAGNDTSDGRAKNRRAEIVVS